MQENPIDLTLEDDDEELTALMNSFAENGGGQKKASDAFQNLLVAPVYMLKEAMAEFIANKPNDQLYTLKKFPLDRVHYNDTTRLMLVITYLSPAVLQTYLAYLKETYPLKAEPNPEDHIVSLSPMEKSDKVKIKANQDSIKDFKKLLKEVTDYNQKLTEVMESVRQFGTVASLGDETLETEGLTKTYYRFPINDKEDYTNAFLKEAWVIAAALMQTVARTVVTDVTRQELEKPAEPDANQALNLGGVLVHQVQTIVIKDEELAPATTGVDEYGIYDITGHKDVTFYFATPEAAQHFEQNKDHINQLFDKYNRYYRER